MLKRGNKLYVGTSDPTQTSAYHAITFKTGMTVEVVVVEDDKLGKMLGKYNEDATAAIKALENEDFGDLEFADPDAPAESGAQPDVDDAPVVKFIHKVLLDAINGGASDIHFEPYEVLSHPLSGGWRAERGIAAAPGVEGKDRLADQGHFQAGHLGKAGAAGWPDEVGDLKARAIDFRVSTLPTLYGEKIVMRILDSSAANLDIEQLGFEPEQKRLLLDAIARPYGMVLVTGPTGSGKTVSLYTCLNLLNKPDINIATAEDPVEINLPGINQVNVNERAGLTFASAKAFLRQDPDVIMVGRSGISKPPTSRSRRRRRVTWCFHPAHQ